MRTPATALLSILLSGGLLMACAGHEAVTAQAAPRTVLERVQALKDPDFNGGLTVEEMTLAQSLADEIAPAASADQGKCGEPDPDAPPTDYRPLENHSAVDLAPQVPEPFRPLAALLAHGSPEQKAVASQSIVDMGKRGGALESLVYVVYRHDGTMWEGEALHALNCERFDPYKVIANTVPASKRPAIGDSCDGQMARWVLQTLGDTSRRWPRGFFLSAWHDATSDCGYDDVAGRLGIPEQTVVGLRPLLDGASVESGRLSDALFILMRLGAGADPVARDVLRYTDSRDNEISFNSSQIVIKAAIPEVVDVIRRHVEQGGGLPADDSEMAELARYSDQLIPIFAEALKSPNFGVRAGAASDLGAMHSTKAIPLLIGAISNDDWVTSQQAVAALAQFASSSPEARAALQRVMKFYWSGRVRVVADIALKTGKAVTDDPFDPCHPGQLVDKAKGLSCVQIGMAQPNHKQKHCRDGSLHSGLYKTTSDKSVHIEWVSWQNADEKKTLPRGNFKDMSIACRHSPDLQLLHMDGGYLAGCTGFEWDGGLIFIPDDPSQPIQRLGREAIQVLTDAGGRTYMVELEGYETGGLFQVSRKPDGAWDFKQVAVLPAVPQGYAVLGDSIAFVDEYTASLYDPDDGLSLLSCKD